MIKYEAPEIEINYFEEILTGENGIMTLNGSTRTAAINLNEAAAIPATAGGVIGSVAARTVRVQTILQFN